MAPGRRPTVRRNPPVNRSTNRNNVDINSGIDTQMLNQLIATRVAEALAAAAVTHAASTQEETNLGSNSSQNKACNYKEFRAVMHENFCGTEGVVGLTRWFEKLESQFRISNVAEGYVPPESTILDMSQANDNELSPRVGETIGDKRKWNGNHYNNNNPNTTSNLNPNKRPETTRVFTARQGSYVSKLPYCGKCGRHHTEQASFYSSQCVWQDIKVKECRASPVPLCHKKDPEAKEDREVMLLASGFGGKMGAFIKQVSETMESARARLKDIREQLKELSDKVTLFFIYSHDEKEHEEHLKTILELLKKEELYAKFSKCEFWIHTVKFLGHVIDSSGIPWDTSSLKGLAGYYGRFIEGFSKIAKPITELTQKDRKFYWGTEQETAFQLLKQKLCAAPILALPEGSDDFVVHLKCSLSREELYTTHDMELGGDNVSQKLPSRKSFGGAENKLVLKVENLEAGTEDVSGMFKEVMKPALMEHYVLDI
ncbi:hypothetical protein Tco_0604540 [Tanacetum coccineum]